MRLGLIGFGSIGRELHKLLSAQADYNFFVLSRSALRDAPDKIQQVRTVDALLQSKPDLVIECAGHAAVRAYAGHVLDAGVSLMIASVGALADTELADEIFAAAHNSGSQLILPSGAIGGLDLLRAVAANGLTQVHYTGSKPPAAWNGSPAEKHYALEDLANRTVIFKGSGRKAALAFPKNANVVAALALACGSFDAIDVELVADPSAMANTHRYRVTSSTCSFEMTIENQPSTGNASTSMTTVLSMLQEIKAFNEQARTQAQNRRNNPWPSI